MARFPTAAAATTALLLLLLVTLCSAPTVSARPAAGSSGSGSRAARRPLAPIAERAATAAAAANLKRAERAYLQPKATPRQLEAPSKLQPRQATPSKRMGQRRRGVKRDADAANKKKDYSSFLCPGGAVACPVVAGEVTPESAAALSKGLSNLADWFRVGFECIELDAELNQCGGCLALGTGRDCSLIDNARNTGCDKGSCVVLQCTAGYSVSSDRSACVKSTAEDQLNFVRIV